MATDKDIYAQTIRQLARDVGYANLACILNVTVEDLHGWADGKTRPPARTFLGLVKIANGDG